jgi:hypothetical protein
MGTWINMQIAPIVSPKIEFPSHYSLKMSPKNL